MSRRQREDVPVARLSDIEARVLCPWILHCIQKPCGFIPFFLLCWWFPPCEACRKSARPQTLHALLLKQIRRAEYSGNRPYFEVKVCDFMLGFTRGSLCI